MKTPPRVVLDTNLVLSALVFTHGRLASLRSSWHAGRCQPLVSRVTIAELIRALGYPKFKLSTAQQGELLADYLPCCVTVRIPTKLPKMPTCRDAFDQSFLELAIVGQADYLATGDRDLHALASRFPVPIVTADHLLGVMREQGG